MIVAEDFAETHFLDGKRPRPDRTSVRLDFIMRKYRTELHQVVLSDEIWRSRLVGAGLIYRRVADKGATPVDFR